MIYILIFLGTSVLWLLVFQIILKQFDRRNWLAFASGMLVGPVAGYCTYLLEQHALPNLAYDRVLDTIKFQDLLLYFFVVGPIEEFGKFLAVIPIALRARHFQKRSDIILLGIATAAGFAAGENVLYYMQYGWPATWPRLWLGNLGHISYTLFWAYALGSVFMEDASGGLLASGLLIASVLHGLYDYCLMLGAIGFLIAMLLAGGLAAFVFYLTFKERQIST